MNVIGLSITRPVFITMITSFFIVVGLISLTRLPVDLYPEVSYPALTVRIELPGASPQEVEQLVTKKMEDALSTLSGLELMRSISRTGTSQVNLEFGLGSDIKFQEMQVRGKLGNLKRSLPEVASDPVIFRQDLDDIPIMEIAIYGNQPASRISMIAEDVLAKRLSQLTGVGAVSLNGERQEEIQIELKMNAMERFQLNSVDVVAAIQKANRNDPAGIVEGKHRKWFLRGLGQISSLEDLRNLPVARLKNGNTVAVRDVATVTESFAEVSRVVTFNDGTAIAPAVVLEVQKQSGENTVEVSDRVRESLEVMQAELPQGIAIKITRDNADLVRVNVADVFESLIIGSALTIFVVLVFLLSPRSTITTGLALPSSIITTFGVMAIAGFSLNVMTLLALSLAVGLLVDDAIVVRENIFRRMTEGKLVAKIAAVVGTQEVALAVIATTLTIVAVFLPVAFMGGVSGQFFKQFALTVVFAILVSLWDALTMAPMLSAYYAYFPDPKIEWMRWGKIGEKIFNVLHKGDQGFLKIERAYEKLLRNLIQRPVLVATITVLIAGGTAISFVALDKTFIPAQLGDVFSVSLNGPLAYPIKSIRPVTVDIHGKLQTIDALDNWTLNFGSGFNGSANINLNIRIKPAFAKSQQQLADVRQQVRTTLSGIPSYSLRLSEPSDPLAGSSGRFQPVALTIKGPDIVQLRNLGRQFRDLMLQVPGITDVPPITDDGLPEIRMQVNHQLAARYGFDAQVVNRNIDTLIDGDVSNIFLRGDDQIPIRVFAEKSLRDNFDQLKQTLLFGATKNLAKSTGVSLSQMVSFDAAAGPAVIVREARERTIRVGGNLEKDAPLGNVIDELKDRLRLAPLPQGYSVRITGQNEQMDELFGNVAIALGLGSIFVFMVLAALFESFLQPIAVMVAIPLAGIGAALALHFAGIPLDLYGGIGIVLLAGIVAKNSILLVDFAIQAINAGEADPVRAVLKTAPLRLRPIFMTSVALIVGMLPIATGLGAGGAARKGLGIATIGGVISSTVLTLIIVPSIFIALERLRMWLKHWKGADRDEFTKV